MKKLFLALLFFTMVGAGVLAWLIYTVPSDKNKSAVHGVTHHAPDDAKKDAKHEGKQDSKNDRRRDAELKHETVSEGVKIVDHDKKTHDEAEPAMDTKGDHKEAKSEKRLMVESEPVRALVYVDGASLGQTPVEIPLNSGPQKVQLVASGYRDFTRMTPTNKEDVKDLHWKVLLKKEEFGRKAAGQAFLKGKATGAFVQLKSVEKSEGAESQVKTQIEQWRHELNMNNIVGCRVQIAGRGQWIRILAGPYASKAHAARALETLRQEHGVQGVLAGAQECQL